MKQWKRSKSKTRKKLKQGKSQSKMRKKLKLKKVYYHGKNFRKLRRIRKGFMEIFSKKPMTTSKNLPFIENLGFGLTVERDELLLTS